MSSTCYENTYAAVECNIPSLMCAWKKQHAALLFATWDQKDEGRVHTSHLRPMLQTLFPLPVPREATSSTTTPAPCTAQTGESPLLSSYAVRHAYESATHRPWNINSMQEASLQGATLNELYAMMDHLFQQTSMYRANTEVDVSSIRQHRRASRSSAAPTKAPSTYTASPAPPTEEFFFGHEGSPSSPHAEDKETSPALRAASTRGFSFVDRSLLQGTFERIFADMLKAQHPELASASVPHVLTYTLSCRRADLEAIGARFLRRELSREHLNGLRSFLHVGGRESASKGTQGEDITVDDFVATMLG